MTVCTTMTDFAPLMKLRSEEKVLRFQMVHAVKPLQRVLLQAAPIIPALRALKSDVLPKTACTMKRKNASFPQSRYRPVTAVMQIAPVQRIHAVIPSDANK